MAPIRRTEQYVVLILVMALAALTGGGIVRAADRARGVSVSMAPGGEALHLWNSTANTWANCSVILDAAYSVKASTIPVRTLVALPRQLFDAPETWEPQRAVVQCQEPYPAQWESSIRQPRF